MNSNDLKVNQIISINVMACDYGVRCIDATITEVREKAVKIQNESGFAWFPKKALVTFENHNDLLITCKIAKWFNLNDFQVRMSEFWDIQRIKDSVNNE